MAKLILWGRGNDAESMMKSQIWLRVLIDVVIDSSAGNTEDFFWGKRVIKKEEVDWKDDIYVVVATRKHFDEISDFLNEKGLRYLDNYCDYDHAWRKWYTAPQNRIYAKRANEFFNSKELMKKWIPNIDDKIVHNLAPFRRFVKEGLHSAERAVVESCVDSVERCLELRNATIEYDQLDDLTVIIHEILLTEDYYFETDSNTPFIIDGGSNIGLSIYYFKYLYPDAHILAFEPNPKMCSILWRNIKRNKWRNIDVMQMALSNVDEGALDFYIQNSGLAGSLEQRNLEGIHEDVKVIRVPVTTLEPFLGEHVDYLKLDIEGSETRVIENIQNKLKIIDYIFIEFHEGKLKGDNSISQIITLLEQNNFDINIGKSFSSSAMTAHFPMKYVGTRVSEVIWAKHKKNGT